VEKIQIYSGFFFKNHRKEVQMEFRPCIDIHNGKVKQIIGGSLKDMGDKAEENFVSAQDAAFFANLYRENGLRGGHVILLNGQESEFYAETKRQALKALTAYPGGLQVGGGITPENAAEFLNAGASHVIVTSYVFREGVIRYDRLEELVRAIGRRHLVLDLSCRRTDEGYFVVTDRWQKMTKERVDEALLDRLSGYCDEFLVHAVDVEGKAEGIEKPLASLLGGWGKKRVTYAGGVHSYEDLGLLRSLGQNRLDVTIGSALDLFGGSLSWRHVLELCRDEIV
jgi:phosphoribosylformimino-5-aminoimidazole carboxamide ribotide isomerase